MHAYNTHKQRTRKRNSLFAQCMGMCLHKRHTQEGMHWKNAMTFVGRRDMLSIVHTTKPYRYSNENMNAMSLVIRIASRTPSCRENAGYKQSLCCGIHEKTNVAYGLSLP